MDELLLKLMGNTGEVSAAVAAREMLDLYSQSDDETKLTFFQDLEQNFNAVEAGVDKAYANYSKDPSSSNLNKLSRAAEPRRHELMRRLNQTPGATHDLVGMRTDLLHFIKEYPELRAVDETFVRLFTSWFGRSFLVLRTIDWSTSASILNRIIRYEAVHAIEDWDDLRRRVDQSNRRCFAFFHPALIDEPLIFVEVALSNGIPGSIASILNDMPEDNVDPSEFTTATFYSISNCQPGLKNISFGNFLIKQVVQELQAEFPSIKNFVTLSPIPGFSRWLSKDSEEESEEVLAQKALVRSLPDTPESIAEHGESIRRLVFNYLVQAKTGKYPADAVTRFHLGNGALIHRLHSSADLSEKGRAQSYGTMVNYLYDLRFIERNHENYVTEGRIEYSDKLKSLLYKP
jgi:malonyl-CoA decarboxylase